ncbi:hypothetical protein C7999DRAFT_35938 [Corynascus novoguineensis]|uniref:Prion-inhibition and propagation HeLo domain-containing protein n=1 Tax=Corynascus novoguineensis TaxID=1126955 RepID=A0AAN7CKH4_9PEZI|nr:hypothetical protein C7999DRAFT_35938 [Corynascus novoguineensis]
MEPVSLGIGLVDLIDPLIQLTGILKAYLSFTTDSDALNAQFEAERLRFERWRRSVGPDTNLFVDQHARFVVENLLSVIDNILETKQSIHQTGKTQGRPWNHGILGTVDQHHPREGDTGSKSHKITWALGRKREVTDLVTRFGKWYSRSTIWCLLTKRPARDRQRTIYGPPGFGKTILSSRIVEHLSAIPNKFVAYFFF